MMEEENEDRYRSELIQYIEGMIPLYEDAKLAQEELLDKNIAYRLLSSIPWKISV